MAPLGTLRERVTIQQPVETPDTQGGRVTTWTTLATVWAAIRPWRRAGGEYLQAQSVIAKMDYEVEIGYRPDVTPKMRLQWTPYRGTVKTLQIVEATLTRERVILQVTEVA
jgi:SPP1 family predicted phage head-tail adaptor